MIQNQTTLAQNPKHVILQWAGIETNNLIQGQRTGSDGIMSASGPAGLEFDPRRVENFCLKIFNLEATRGGDVHFLIARLYITDLD